MVSRDASFKFPSGQDRVLLHQGTGYVRRSAGNHLVDARDLDGIISRRIEHFKSSLLDKIARVVESPPYTEILVVSKVPTDEPHSKFVIDNAPDALSVKGMSFTVSPPTTEQEIVAWMAMTRGDENAVPARGISWKWYRERKKLKLTPEQRLHTAIYSLLNEVPAFFWLQGCKASEIKPALLGALSGRIDANCVSYVLCIGAFLGKRFHGSLVSHLGESMARRVGRALLTFPAEGPRSILRADAIALKKSKQGNPAQIRAAVEEQLDAIAASAKTSPNNEPELMHRWLAQRLDCYLYAQDDQYA